jgi:phage gp16-like protein
MSYPAKFKQADSRRRDIQLIHVARQKLAMDEDTYRAMLWSVARVKSSTELDFAGRKKVLDHLKASGFKVVAKRSGSTPRPAPSADKSAQVAKIRALLIALDNKPDAYADGMAKHMFKVDRFEWCTGAQLGKIIAALSYQANKAAS